MTLVKTINKTPHGSYITSLPVFLDTFDPLPSKNERHDPTFLQSFQKCLFHHTISSILDQSNLPLFCVRLLCRSRFSVSPDFHTQYSSFLSVSLLTSTSNIVPFLVTTTIFYSTVSPSLFKSVVRFNELDVECEHYLSGSSTVLLTDQYKNKMNIVFVCLN